MNAEHADSSDDSFGGAWLVAEYVHNPDGTFVGVVHQRRLVEPIEDGRLRVTQICEPAPELATHPMGAFAGEWIFDLEVDGAHRHYLGPDVVGVGTQWQPGAMTGQGMWPRFGHEFTSYGVLVADDRQLTGGFFSMAGRSVADIVGVAVPESAGVEPTLDLNAEPAALDETWTLKRSVGPMRIGYAQPSATEQRKRYELVDTIGGTSLSIEQRSTFGEMSETTISIGQS